MQNLSAENRRHSAEPIKQSWENLLRTNPKLRIRDAAQALNVSEAELLSTGCGTTVTRLAGDWIDLIRQLPGVGPLMALTRNDYAVHEKTGYYVNVRQAENLLMVSGKNIDLCLLMDRWHMGFAVAEQTHAGTRHSLQFFTANGQAVHKVYLADPNGFSAYRRLIEAFQANDQSQEQRLSSIEAIPKPSASVAGMVLPEHWQRIVECCFGKATRQVMVAKTQLASRLFWEFMHLLAQIKLPIQLVVKNNGALQLHSGSINNLKITGPWLNVLDETFNLHLNENGIVDLRVTTTIFWDKPVTGLELCDGQGDNFVALFGSYQARNGEDSVWRELIAALPNGKLA